jgi:hypothetical protein
MTLKESDALHSAAIADMQAGHQVEAAEKLSRILVVWKRELGADSKDAALCLSQLESSLINSGRPEDALLHLRATVKIRGGLLGEDRSWWEKVAMDWGRSRKP